jgi:unsaturated chondroitin disaccharide hydrolase
MATSHALTSARAHVRPDGSTAHVALFDPATGALERTVTWQGYSDSSAWARGQAWAINGFTAAYGETKRPELLSAAQRAADYFIAHLPSDGVPYWDFRDPAIPNVPRDASAAAIAASGLLDLTGYSNASDATRYRDAAMHILHALATGYLARGTNSSAILLHSTGGRPQNSEVDVGLVYADYYFVEALVRARRR